MLKKIFLLVYFFPCLLLLFCRDHFYQFGEINSIHVVPKQKCAFVTFTTRQAAEKAADGSFNKVIIKGMTGIVHISSVVHDTACRASAEDSVGEVPSHAGSTHQKGCD